METVLTLLHELRDLLSPAESVFQKVYTSLLKTS